MATVTSSKRHLLVTSDTYTSNGDVTVGGDLFVNGSQTIINTTTLNVEDKNITLNYGGTEASSQGAGITIVGSNATFIWDEANTRWSLSDGLVVSGNISASNLSGTNTGDQDLSGYATTGSIPTDFVSKANGGTFSGSLIVGSTSSTANKSLKVLAGDSFIASIEAFGGSQGTGKLYVGQASNYGGGIMYNGDDNPNLPQTSDAISFYRRTADTEAEVFSYPHNSSVVTFVSDIVINGGDITLGGTGRIQGVDTVSAGTDAANKTYVDNAISTATGAYLQLSGGTMSGGINMNGNSLTNVSGISGNNFNISGVNQLSINDPGEGIYFAGTTNVHLYAIDDATDSIMNFSNASELRVNNNKVWTAANDGSGSGLDADLLDGQHGSYYAAASSLGNYLPLAGGTMTGDLLMDGKAGVGNVIGLATGINSNAMSLKLYTYNNIDPGGGLGTSTGNMIQADLGSNLVLRQTASDGDITFQSDDGSGGIATYFQLDGSHTQSIAWKDIHFVDGIKAKFGDYASPDLQIYHDGSDSYIDDTGTGWLRLRGNGGVILSSYSESEIMLQATRNGAVSLYYDNSKKLETTSTGVSITGGGTFTGDVTLANGNALRWTSDDVRIEGTTAGDNIKFYVANTEILQLAQSGTLATVTGDLRVTGAYYDSNNSAGTSGQVLSSTGSATSWVSGSGLPGGPYLPLAGGTMTGNLNINTSTNFPLLFTGTNSNYTAIGIKNTGTGDAGIYMDGMNGDFGGSDYAFIGQKDEGYLLYNIGVNSPLPYHIFTGGNVGIGITSPSEKLHIYNGTAYVTPISYAANQSAYALKIGAYNNTAFDMGLKIKSTAGGSPYMSFETSTASDVLVMQGANVGIGTTSPSYKLDVDGDGRFGGTTTAANTALTVKARSGDLGDLRFRFDAAGTLQRSYISDYYTGEASNIGFERNNSTGVGVITFDTSNGSFSPSERMRITSAGDVGIGTTSPSTKLEVVDTFSVQRTSADNEGLYVTVSGADANAIVETFYQEDSSSRYGIRKRYDGSTNLYQEFIHDNSTTGTEVYRVDRGTKDTSIANGNVGIGTTSPGAKLDIFNTGGSAGSLADCQTYSALTIKPYSSVDSKLTFSANGVSTQLIQATNNAGTTGRQISLQPFSGNVGIGVTLPSEKLDVNGHIKAFNGYKGYVSDFNNGGFFHSPRSTDGANPLFIPINSTGMTSSDQYYNTWVPLYAGRVRKIILKHVSGSTPVATVCTFRKKINGVLSGTTYAGTVTNGGAVGMKVTFDFGTSNFTFNAEDEVQIGVVTGVATQPRMGGMSYQIWYEYNVT